MKSLLVLLLHFHCLSLVLCSLQWATLRRWQEWKQQFNQDFGPSADSRRRAIWTRNLQLIADHNKNYLLGYNKFTMAINKFGATADYEYFGMLGARVSDSPMTSQEPVHFTPPSSLDYRTQGFVTPVKDQGTCGSSWAFSVTGAIEAQVAKTTGVLVSLSEQDLLDCSKVNVTYGCDGAWMSNAYDYVQTHGLNGDANYPYEARDDQPCMHDPDKNVIMIRGHKTLPPGDEDMLKTSLAFFGPITVAVDASNWSFMFYNMGIYDEPLCDAAQANHAVLLVGYGSENGVDYWIVKNSWGLGWGEEGYMRVLRGNNLCGIASYALYPVM
ncbi:digestive cysteine proteinase 2-like [Salminus brasiliensis]|uniref:digestive cysteine proteinase 2-like n=1 Tax=Salminus brasiliensis TaxID=930266 RepID=UPI003B83A215